MAYVCAVFWLSKFCSQKQNLDSRIISILSLFLQKKNGDKRSMVHQVWKWNRRVFIRISLIFLVLVIGVGSSLTFMPSDISGQNPCDKQLVTCPWVWSGKTCLDTSGGIRYLTFGQTCASNEVPDPLRLDHAFAYNIWHFPGRLFYTIKHVYETNTTSVPVR